MLIKSNLVCIPFKAFSTCLYPDTVSLVLEFKLAVISFADLSDDSSSFTFIVFPVALICSNLDFKSLANAFAFLNSLVSNKFRFPFLEATLLTFSIIALTLESADSKLDICDLTSLVTVTDLLNSVLNLDMPAFILSSVILLSIFFNFSA